MDIFLGADMITVSLCYMKPASVPVRHSFELTNNQTVYQPGRLMAPKHNEIIWKDQELMPKAGIITSAS